jgi:hypothetical protein
MKSLLHSHASAFYTKYASDLACSERALSIWKVNDFIDELADNSLLLTDFSWDDWYSNSHLVDKPQYIASASLHECQLLLTAITRLERLSPGVLDNMRRSGVLLAILERFNNISLKLST